MGIQFRLACIDPTGNPTNGIRRVQGDRADYVRASNADGTPDDATIGIKANDAAWNRDQYLNIWTANFSDGTLGYAQPPGTAANIDGVVIQFNAFGRTGNLQANYDRGRTATHEVGHWLSLLHIWGDDGGTCTGTDNVADTPNQADSYAGQCPSGQRFSCGTSNMYQNYMDYTNDACMNLFTSGQSDRMKALFLAGNARSGFISLSNISGNAFICDGNTYTYSVNSSGTSFNWNVSPNLSITSGQGTNQITIVKNSGGSGSVTVSSQGLCSSRNVWIGNPNLTKTINGNTNSTAPVSAGNLYNLVASSASPSTSFDYNDYTGYGDISLTIYNPDYANTNMYVSSNSTYGNRSVKVTATNVCGSYSEDFVFYLYSGYRVASNPAKDNTTVIFDDASRQEALPDEIDLLSEKSTVPVRIINVQEMASRKSFKDGNSIEINVADLPRGTYYLHIKNSRREDKQVDIIRLLLE